MFDVDIDFSVLEALVSQEVLDVLRILGFVIKHRGSGESKLVLDKMEDNVTGKQEEMKKIQEIIASLSKECST